MAKFAYNAIDAQGNEQYGVVDCESETDALNEIGRLGLFPTNVRPANVTDDWRVQWKDERRRQDKEEERKERHAKKAHPRQRLVVRFKDGRTVYGVCFALNPKEPSFYLDIMDSAGISTGKTEQIDYADIKAVFYVKSFDGKFDKHTAYRDWTPEGTDVVVEFEDGETVEGSTLHRYTGSEPRFYVIPKDTKGNNISILVEKSAVASMSTPQEYRARKEAEKEEKKQDASVDLSQEETMGDFYFETRNYPDALEQFNGALKKFPQSHRLRRKILVCKYNIGVQFIKRREYTKALDAMQEVLKLDPRNEHAKKKTHQLRKIIERAGEAQQRGPEIADF